MAAEAADNPVTGPGDSLKVRWIVPGLLRTAMREWFARFPAETERREDIYLLHPRLRGLSVKLRDRSALDVKACLGNLRGPRLARPRPSGILAQMVLSCDLCGLGWRCVRRLDHCPQAPDRQLWSSSPRRGDVAALNDHALSCHHAE
jgi:hypothetical protein